MARLYQLQTNLKPRKRYQKRFIQFIYLVIARQLVRNWENKTSKKINLVFYSTDSLGDNFRTKFTNLYYHAMKENSVKF